MPTSHLCPSCGLEVPPDAMTCPHDGTQLRAVPSRMASPLPGDTLGFGATRVRRRDSVSQPKSNPFDSSTDSNAGAPSAGDKTFTGDPLIGHRLGEYVVEGRIGIGGMGIVYRGRQPEIGKPVAIKILRPEIADDPDQVERLLSEARAVNAIGHRGIIDIFSFGKLPDGRRYFVMELLEGQPLDRVMAEKGPMPATEVIPLLEDILVPLGAAHAAGVIHRDLKPNNLFLVSQPDGSRFLKILDFGLAKQTVTPGGMTPQTRNAIVGTPEYMAPEQGRCEPVGPRTDLYAVGVIAYQMLTARLPFLERSPIETLMAHLNKAPTPPSQLVEGVPEELEGIILELLAKSPDDRPPSADVVRQRLRVLRKRLQMEGTQIRPVAFPTPPSSPSPGQARALSMARTRMPEARPDSTPAVAPVASAPAAVPSIAPATAPVPSTPSGPESGRPGASRWIALAALVVLVAGGGVWLWRGRARAEAGEAARLPPKPSVPAVVQAATRAPTVPKPAPAKPTPVASAPASSPTVPTPTVATEPPSHASTIRPATAVAPAAAASPPPATPEGHRHRRGWMARHGGRAPSKRVLQSRIRRMRRRLIRRTPPGQEPDPLVLHLLDRADDMARSAADRDERQKVAAFLNDVKHKYLAPGE